MAEDNYSGNSQTKTSKSMIPEHIENQADKDVPEHTTITKTTKVTESETTGQKERPKRDIKLDDYALNKPKRIIIRAKLLND